ncbi:hypothetical protein [Porphyrobacter sp. ULC335]|nr:hypothetical protein [Porphyrobacter sp. ULC335]UYV16614.1 hypothetical protein KVF90_04640 [Porphyrobacter sp. ULC335]
MHNPNTRDERPLDLGKASVETRGNAVFDVDLSTGPSRYIPGVAGE